MADHFEALMRATLAGVPGNPEGYAFYRDPEGGEAAIRATCSTNGHAGWTRCIYNLTQQPADKVRAAIAFFRQHNCPVKARIVPDGFSPAQADVLTELGLRHIGFHAVMWAPLAELPSPSLAGAPALPAGTEIRPARTAEEVEAHIDLQLRPYKVPVAEVDSLRPLRRPWWALPSLRFYTAYVDGAPAAQAILYAADGIGLLASASTLPEYRGRGLQTALIRHRIAEARALGCEFIIGAADFESSSRTNQMACGLHMAYTAAWWTERAAGL